MLSALQWQFIAARLTSETDQDAAKLVGVHPTRVSDWKRENAEFLQEYEASFKDGVHVAKSYSRKLLGKAAQRISEALDATKLVSVEVIGELQENGKPTYQEFEKPDHTLRLKAAELLFKSHGLLRDRIDIEFYVRQLAESRGLDPEEVVKAAELLLSEASKGVIR